MVRALATHSPDYRSQPACRGASGARYNGARRRAARGGGRASLRRRRWCVPGRFVVHATMSGDAPLRRQSPVDIVATSAYDAISPERWAERRKANQTSVGATFLPGTKVRSSPCVTPGAWRPRAPLCVSLPAPQYGARAPQESSPGRGPDETCAPARNHHLAVVSSTGAAAPGPGSHADRPSPARAPTAARCETAGLRFPGSAQPPDCEICSGTCPTSRSSCERWPEHVRNLPRCRCADTLDRVGHHGVCGGDLAGVRHRLGGWPPGAEVLDLALPRPLTSQLCDDGLVLTGHGSGAGRHGNVVRVGIARGPRGKAQCSAKRWDWRVTPAAGASSNTFSGARVE